jgi:signal transduction histidine kinase
MILEVEDDGEGFDPNTTPVGGGLRGIRERASALGGNLAVKSQVGQGTRVRLAFRLPGQVT